MQMIADSLSKVGYLTLVLLIVLVIFALAGMQTVGKDFYKEPKVMLSLECIDLLFLNLPQRVSCECKVPEKQPAHVEPNTCLLD